VSRWSGHDENLRISFSDHWLLLWWIPIEPLWLARFSDSYSFRFHVVSGKAIARNRKRRIPMTTAQWEKTCELLIDALSEQSATNERLRQSVIDLKRQLSGLETCMSNIRGMAVNQFPDLECVSVEYEAIRLAFLRIRDGERR
jgi:hypothetical protein